MKTTETVSFSIPISLLQEVDNIAEMMHISRSALLTAILSIAAKWATEATASEKKQILNSLYGKKG